MRPVLLAAAAVGALGMLGALSAMRRRQLRRAACSEGCKTWGELLALLVGLSRRSCAIAQTLRASDASLRTQVKGADGNPRFDVDVKTLGDVLVQEYFRWALNAWRPGLGDVVQGEEAATFSLGDGRKITVVPGETEAATVEMLREALEPRVAAALARLVHAPLPVRPLDAEVPDLPLDVDSLGIWIDPIDGTNEFVRGEVAADSGDADELPLAGLRAVTVLVGAFDRTTGAPLAGVVSRPFLQRSDGGQGWRSGVYWGLYLAERGVAVVSGSLRRAQRRGRREGMLTVCSASELPLIAERLRSLGEVATPAGAGNKLLAVALNQADAFVLSRPTTFKWDLCGPHAILHALGHSVHDLRGEDIQYHRPDAAAAEPGEWNNAHGVVAVQNRCATRLWKELGVPRDSM